MEDIFWLIVITNTVICGHVAIDIFDEGIAWFWRYWNNV